MDEEDGITIQAIQNILIMKVLIKLFIKEIVVSFVSLHELQLGFLCHVAMQVVVQVVANKL